MNKEKLNEMESWCSDLMFFSRFWSKVDVLKNRQCWEWRGYVDNNGYGKISYKGKPISSHVASCVYFKGLFDNSKIWVDHICMNRSCVNPNHLRLVSPKISSTENTNGSAAKNKVKKECPSGHEYNEQNTVFKKNKNGGTYRQCKKCISEYKKRLRARSFGEGGE